MGGCETCGRCTVGGRHFRMVTVVLLLGLARELVRTAVMTWVRALRRGTGGDVHCAKEMWNEIHSVRCEPR